MAKKTATSTMPKSMTPTTAAARTPRTGGNGGQVSREQVAWRAFEIYRQRCQKALPGDAVSDWLKAEAELRASVGRRAST